MHFFSNVVAVAVATAALLLVPSAQAAPAAQEDLPNLTNPTQVVDTIVADDLAQLVREIGGVDVQVRDSNGKKGYRSKTATFLTIWRLSSATLCQASALPS